MEFKEQFKLKLKSFRLWYNKLEAGPRIAYWGFLFNIVAWVIVEGATLIYWKNTKAELTNAHKEVNQVRTLKFGFDLKNKFPEYWLEQKDVGGQWIRIPYVFNNLNDYTVYYRVLWQLTAERKTEKEIIFEPTADYVAFNETFKIAIKQQKDEGSIKTLIGKNQIDWIYKEKRRIQLLTYIQVWDKQNGPFNISELPTKQITIIFEGSYKENGQFAWKVVEVKQESPK
ncbi:MAG: hypothetical protein NTU54_02715 [Candidatus Omnitrophica bacterium]|nr:hypothetical protein [Candidatus Omnitrophota bacterium]